MNEPQGEPRAARRALVWFWGTGGAGVRLADRFAACLGDILGPSAVALSCHADNPFAGAARTRGHPVHVVGGAAGQARKGGLALQAAPRLLALLRHLQATKPDVVFIPMNFALAWPFCLILRPLRIRFVAMLHDPQPHPGDFAPRWQIATQRGLLASAQAILAPSAYTQRALERTGVARQPVLVVPLAALAKPRRADPRPRPRTPVRLLFMGRMIAYKGLDLLAEALQPLAGRADWTLTIAGDGPDAARVAALFASFPQVDLSRLRHMEEAEIDPLLSSHDVLVCPYTEASQSGVIAEAQADGMPAIVTPAGALPEQIEDGLAGWPAQGMTADDLRQAIVFALDDGRSYRDKSTAALRACSPDAAVRAFRAVLGLRPRDTHTPAP